MSTAEKQSKRSRKQGATSHRQRAASRMSDAKATALVILRQLFRAGLAASVLAAAVATVYFAKSFVDRAAERPIQSIGVEGQFVHISREEISQLVTPMIKGGFLQSSLAGIKNTLESNPWVAQAAVSRRWPDELYISIVEEQPIARWGKVGFLNHRGDLIRVEENRQLRSLPVLSGRPGQERSVMQQYQQLAQLFRPYGLRISEFHSDELFAWNLILENGLKISLGRDQTMEKIQRFLVVYNRELRQRMDEIAVVDLRYGNGLAVQWKSATAESSAAAGELDKKA